MKKKMKKKKKNIKRGREGREGGEKGKGGWEEGRGARRGGGQGGEGSKEERCFFFGVAVCSILRFLRNMLFFWGGGGVIGATLPRRDMYYPALINDKKKCMLRYSSSIRRTMY